MMVQIECQKLMEQCSFTFKMLCVFLLFLAGATSSENTKCPFQYVYHFGDGVTDIGNSIHVLPWVYNPARRLPYGRTFPGSPTGRWSDGLIDFDFTAKDFGLPNIVPYLAMNSSATSYDGIIFSVARSPVLDRWFFKGKGIVIPPFAVSLRGQMSWFRKHLKSICSTRQECANWLGKTLILMGDIEGNDIGYALTQGRSLAEVETYVPFIIDALIDASREMIYLGAKRVIIPGNGPLGCYPYILTALPTSDLTAYDELGCLKDVNDFVIWKNNYLHQAITDLKDEFPDTLIYYGDMYEGVQSLINASSNIGQHGNIALKACCGIGGHYNYDSKRFCGSPGVPVCHNPNEFVFWDGIHFTQHFHYTMEHLLVQPALVSLNCTTDLLLYGSSSARSVNS